MQAHEILHMLPPLMIMLIFGTQPGGLEYQLVCTLPSFSIQAYAVVRSGVGRK